MKIILVVGARPNFMKVAPIIAAMQRYNSEVTAINTEPSAPTIERILVHTGQHYDALMSEAFFTDLNLPAPDIHLRVGSGSPVAQTAEILHRFEEVLLSQRPDAVIVVGDVNSTVACALATAKVSFDSTGKRPLLAHVEAGLRSFDRLMPEEINRVVTDHVSDLLLVTEESGVRNLLNEGIAPEAIHFVGNTMIDSLLRLQEKADRSDILERLDLRSAANNGDHTGNGAARYALLTLHRPSNVDNRETFQNILGGVEQLAKDCPVVFPVHPRTQKQIREFGFAERLAVRAGNGHGTAGLILTEPLGYLDFVCLMKHACVVVTDSGGIQEETSCLGVPCVTVRENTERPVTVANGTNVIAGTAKEKIQAAIRQQMGRKVSNGVPEKWDGHAGERIVEVLQKVVAERKSSGGLLPRCVGEA